MSIDTQVQSVVDQHFRFAVDHFKNSRFQVALQLAEQLIPQDPHNLQVVGLAAACARRLGMFDKAERYLRSIISVRPDFAEPHNDLGLLLKEQGRHAEAEDLFNAALKVQPNLVSAHVNRGNLLRLLERTKDAEAAYRKALEIQPNHVSALYNLGLLVGEQSRNSEAETLFRQSLAQNPNQADVLNSLGKLLAESSRNDEAESAFAAAIRLQPNFADAHFNLAVLYCETRRFKDALEPLKHALDADPNHANALNCFGNVMMGTGLHEKAEMAYRRALEIAPDSANVHSNLGNLLMERDKLTEAEAEFRGAFALEKDYGYAIGQAVSCARQCYSWTRFREDNTLVLSAIDRGVQGIPALIMQSLTDATPDQLKKAGILNSQHKIQTFLDRQALVPPSHHIQRDRLRIGIISPDFREHAVMHLAAGVFEAIDRSRFFLHAYSLGPNTGDSYRQRIENSAEVFRDVSQTASVDIARQIADDGIDILVDLGGYTTGARPEVSAMRPAPIIVNWLGYPGSMGIPTLADYIIGDAVLTPLEFQTHYSETLALMPDCYQPNDAGLSIQPASSRREVGLPEDAVVFCSFNQAYKLNPEMFDVWCDLLRCVPGSVLWLLMPKDPQAITNLRKEAAGRGISDDRLVFAPALPLNEHLSRLTLADLALDTYPYGSGATGSNVLYAGVPMITLKGKSYVSRMASSQLHYLGLDELVTESLEEYAALGRRLAEEPVQRDRLRQRLKEARSTSPLFNTHLFARNLERLLLQIWHDHAEGVRRPIIMKGEHSLN